MEVLDFMLDTWWYFGILMAIGVGLALKHNQGYIDLNNLIWIILFGMFSYFGLLILIIFVIVSVIEEFGDKKIF